MIHQRTNAFKNLLDNISKQTLFNPALLEKDYYLTLLLSNIKDLCPNLIFKGGTALNKIYFDYHRLSEDLDFSLLFRLPSSLRA
jgi:predicted nucleotidyltransferase component of viral defense system